MIVTAQGILDALGGRRVLKRRGPTADRLRDQVRTGLPYAALEAIAQRLAVTAGDLGEVVGLGRRTLARRRKAGRLTASESDRLARVGRIVAQTEEVLGNRVKAARWLSRPNLALGRIAPMRLLDTDIGACEVETILGRIEHGVYS